MRAVRRGATGITLVCLVATVLAGCVGTGVVDQTSRRLSNGMSTQEIMTARVVAMRRVRKEGAAVTATVTVSKGKVPAMRGFHHHACSSGRLLHITLRGVFPHTEEAPVAGDGDSAPVQGEELTVDAAEGTICGASYLTGTVLPDVDALVLFSG